MRNMSSDGMLVAAILCQAMVFFAPFYLVVFRSRFFAAFLATWFFLYAAETFSVHRGWILYDEGIIPQDSPPADTTNIGLVIFSGWILAFPYCLILKLVRGVLERNGIINPFKA